MEELRTRKFAFEIYWHWAESFDLKKVRRKIFFQIKGFHCWVQKDHKAAVQKKFLLLAKQRPKLNFRGFQTLNQLLKLQNPVNSVFYMMKVLTFDRLLHLSSGGFLFYKMTFWTATFEPLWTKRWNPINHSSALQYQLQRCFEIAWIGKHKVCFDSMLDLKLNLKWALSNMNFMDNPKMGRGRAGLYPDKKSWGGYCLTEFEKAWLNTY